MLSTTENNESLTRIGVFHHFAHQYDAVVTRGLVDSFLLPQCDVLAGTACFPKTIHGLTRRMIS
jgi:hypothetical protein